MKKNFYLAILGIVTVFCMIVGLIIHSTGRFSFQKEGEFGQQMEDEVVVEHMEAFDSIDVDVKLIELTVETGENYGFSYKSAQKIVPEYSVENRTLKIRQPQPPKTLLKNSKNCKATITVPADVKLKKTQIIANVCEIRVNDLFSEELKLKSNVGEVNVRNVQAKNAELTADVGEVQAEACNFETANVQTNVGDVKLEEMFFENMTINGNTGDVKLDTNIALDSYQMNLATDVGEVEFNDQDYKKNYQQNGGEGTLTISTNVGDIHVEAHD